MKPGMKRVAIVGGGITGLSAAYALQEAANAAGEVDYLLIERDQRLGGKILTEKVDGFTIEGGPDCFLSEKPWVAELSRRLGITHRLLCSNEDRKGIFVLSGGRLHRLPEGIMLMVPTRILPFALSPLISWPGKLRMALDLVLPKKKGDEDETLASFVTRRLGREALEKIAGPLIGGIHGSDAEEMSLKAAFPRFLQMEQEYGSLIRAMLAARKKAPAPATGAAGRPKRTYFMSFVDGMGELTATVGSRLNPEKVLTGRKATGIIAGGGAGGKGYTVQVEGMQPVNADAIIITVPANDAADLLEGLDRQMAGSLRKIPMATSATISVAYRRSDVPHPLEGFGFMVPFIENRKISAVTFSSVKWDYRVPDPEHVLLRTFVGGALHQELVDLEDDELMGLVRRELKDILGIKAAPVLAMIHRWVKCRPRYTLGHLERVAAIEERAAIYPGLYLAGGSYRGIGVPDCINSGTLAADKALAYLKELA